ncbi:hypothetical protein D3C86_2158580 [compost metagenome]
MDSFVWGVPRYMMRPCVQIELNSLDNWVISSRPVAVRPFLVVSMSSGMRTAAR